MRLSSTAALIALLLTACGSSAGSPSPGGQANATLSADEQTGVDRVNHWRMLAGLPPVAPQPEVQAAAQAHLSFVVHDPMSCWPGLHDEVESSSCPGFTGADVGARLQAAGYTWSAWTEAMMMGSSDSTTAVDAWVWAVYHRLVVLDTSVTDIGFAHDETISVLDLAAPSSGPAPDPSDAIVFPPDGMTGVPTWWSGVGESPTPPAPSSGWPSGPVISLRAPSASWQFSAVKVTATSAPTEQLGLTVLKPQTDSNLSALNADDVIFYPDTHLDPSTSYTVTVTGTMNSMPWQKTWSFTTAGP